MTGPYAERIRVLEAQLKDADKAHAKTLFEFHEMKARAEAAEKRVAELEDVAASAKLRAGVLEKYLYDQKQLVARAEAAEKREAALRASIEKMLNGEIPLSISIKAHFLAALDTKAARAEAGERTMTFTDKNIDDMTKIILDAAGPWGGLKDAADMLRQLKVDRAFLRTEIEAMRQAIRLRDEQISALQARIESADTLMA